MSTRSASERAPVNPYHDRQLVPRLARSPDVQIEAVLALLGWRRKIHRSLRIGSLRAFGTKSITLTHTTPGHHRLRSFPPEAADWGGSERNPLEAPDAISNRARNLASLYSNHVGRDKAVSMLSSHRRKAAQ